jgi:hypothetical protein
MNEKFKVINSLSKRGEELILLIKEYKETEKDIVKNAIKRAIEVDYGKKLDISIIDSMNIEDIKKAIHNNKYFLKNDEDIAKEAVAFAESYFKGDCILIEPDKNMSIKISRKYGIKRSQIPELFGVTNNCEIDKLWRSDFVEIFVDKYVRTNIIRILDKEKENKIYSYKISKVYFNERFYNVDVSVTIPIKELDSNTLYWFKDLLEKITKVY